MEPNEPVSRLAEDVLASTRASLLARLKELGDNQSWKDFFDTYHRLIYGTVLKRGLSHHDAEEIVAQILVGVAKRMPKFVYQPAVCRFKTWLFRVVDNQVADHFRRNARSLPTVSFDSGDLVCLDQIPDPASVEPGEDWEDLWQSNLTQVALERVRQRANPRHLQLYLYSEWEGHSVAETAAHMQTTTNAVSVARNRMRKMLRAEGERLRKQEERLGRSID